MTLIRILRQSIVLLRPLSCPRTYEIILNMEISFSSSKTLDFTYKVGYIVVQGGPVSFVNNFVYLGSAAGAIFPRDQ